MIISVINEKGGSGKTSLAINLACKLNDEGDKVLFLDLDPQRSAEIFVNIRKGEKLQKAFDYKRKPNLLNTYDSIIIDTGGRDSKEMHFALKNADIVLIPTYPSQYDLAVLNNMIELFIKEAKKEAKCFIIINRAFTNASLKNRILDFKELVKNKTNQNIFLMDSILYDREAIRKATSEGLGISQTQNNKAKRDFSLFFDELIEKYNN
ncbi:ParA family protein [Campylobacter helveticus]|uniref:ParA family protein n=1 Tax=Campylobacter helveticus TaxID=28898 RepID=UPI0011122DC3|nr:ParA family protein [Campylobacter helveticus]TNB63244.1 ParA family protein [Campylobacter helveticus]